MNSSPAQPSRKKLLAEFSPVGYEDWRRLVEAELKGASFDKRMLTSTYEGITFNPLYCREDTASLPHVNSFPGFAPFVRGTSASGCANKPWIVSQEINCSDPAQFNRTARDFLGRGLNALNIILDLKLGDVRRPDPPNPAEAGQRGLSIATLADLEKSLEGIDLATTHLFIHSGDATLPFAAFLVALSRKRKIESSRLKGCIEADPLGLLAKNGALNQSLPCAFEEMAVLTRWAATHAPDLKTIFVNCNTWHEAGGNAVQELAYALATGIEYLREMNRRGIDVNMAAPQMRFSFTAGTHFFMEIAKLRAARLLWSRAVAALGGDENSQKLAMHVRTSLWNKTVYDPHNNLLRATVEAFAAVLGGCDSLEVGAFDEVIHQPDDFSLRLARNTQLILQKECNLTHVIDPTGGSWLVETITDELAGRAWKLFQEIEKLGGMAAAMSAGVPQAAVAATAKEKINAVNRRRDSIIGINQYADLKTDSVDTTNAQTKSAQTKHSFSSNPVNEVILERLSKIQHLKDTVLLEACIEAANMGATLGDINRAVRGGNMAVTTATPVCVTRAAVQFERLRAATDHYFARHKVRLSVFLCNMGPSREHKARADFSRGFFAAGGYDVISPAGFKSAEEAAMAFADSKARVAVICSTDDNYPMLVPSLVAGIRSRSPDAIIVLAGFPQNQIEAHKKSGVNEFIHVRADVVELLAKFHKELGITG